MFGPLVGWVAGALEGAAVVGGLSALGAGLYSIGIPQNSIVEYETALKSNKFPRHRSRHSGRGGPGEEHPRDGWRGASCPSIQGYATKSRRRLE